MVNPFVLFYGGLRLARRRGIFLTEEAQLYAENSCREIHYFACQPYIDFLPKTLNIRDHGVAHDNPWTAARQDKNQHLKLAGLHLKTVYNSLGIFFDNF